MKTIFLFLFVIGFSICTIAQNLEANPFPKIDFNKGWQKDITLTFKNSPQLKFDLPFEDPGFSLPLQEENKDPKALPNTQYSSLAFQFRMPVVEGQYPSRMPVMVPDSTVRYFLRIKRIPFDNPLDRRWK